jgi:hypothetical protein
MADEVIHPFLPEQEYEDPNVISTYDFIYFVQDYTAFFRRYLNYMLRENYITSNDFGYYSSYLDICNEINTDYGDDGTFEQYRQEVEPLMEWITDECGHMNEYYEHYERNAIAQEEAPTGVSSRTRSKRPASAFEILPAKKGTNMISLEPTTQNAVRIKLSDGKEYTYDEIKDMWRFSKEQTPLRHPYTEEDKQKIKDFIDFATKGGKRKTRKGKKTKKSHKTKKSRKIRRSRK